MFNKQAKSFIPPYLLQCNHCAPACPKRSTAQAALWARIAQNVKKKPLTENVINFELFGLMYPYVSFGVPFVPKRHDTLIELFRFTRFH